MALALGTNCGFVETAPVDDPAENNATCDNYLTALRDNTPATAVKVTEIGFWCDSQGDEGQNWEVGIYDDDSDTPKNLLAGADQTNVLSAGAGWKSVVGLNITVTPETTYWIGIQWDNSTVACNYNYSSATGVGKYIYITPATTLLDPWVGGSSTTRINSMYAVWEAAAVEGEAQIISIIMSKLLFPFFWLKQGKTKRRDFLKNTFLASMGIK